MSGPVDRELAGILRTCAVSRSWAEQDEGPYHRDAPPDRRDITEDRVGAPLQLGLRLMDAAGDPGLHATVEVWQCDALGRYSGFPAPTPAIVVEEDATFLRGGQATDDDGVVEFRTIYPGWYPGRTVHIHLRVHVGERQLTSQLYFLDTVSDSVFARAPYAERPDRDTFNDTDTIYSTGGDPALLDLSSSATGFRAALSLVLPA